MSRVVVDRIEDDVAVLASDDTLFELPRSLLPPDAKEGSVLRLTLEIDHAASREAKDAVAKRLQRLTADDDGGDFSL